MKHVFVAIFFILTTQAHALTLKDELSNFSDAEKLVLEERYENLLTSDFVVGIYCEPVGDSAEQDANRSQFCWNILDSELELILSQKWQDSFQSKNDSIITLKGIDYKFFEKRFIPESPTGDSLCDFSVLVPVSNATASSILFDVYCD